MNATPSGSRASLAGGRGKTQARRVVSATGPSCGPPVIVGRDGHAGRNDQMVREPIGGTRCAMMVRRGARSARHTAQGRVGDIRLRHIAKLLVVQPLLSANTSATADAVRPHPSQGANPWRPLWTTAHVPASTPEARRTDRPPPHPGARGNELAPPPARTFVVVATTRRGTSRGKGVLAA